MKTKQKDSIKRNGVFAWIALGTGLLLSIPLIAMQFTDEVQWTLTDFIIMGVIIFSMSSLFVVVARRAPRRYRLFIGAGFVLAFLWLWAELAVGVFTNWGS